MKQNKTSWNLLSVSTKLKMRLPSRRKTLLKSKQIVLRSRAGEKPMNRPQAREQYGRRSNSSLQGNSKASWLKNRRKVKR